MQIDQLSYKVMKLNKLYTGILQIWKKKLVHS